MSSVTVPVRPLSLRALLDEALRAARRHVRQLLLPVVVPLALFNGLFTLAQHWAQQQQRSESPRPMVMAFFVLALLAFVAAQALGSAVLTSFAVDVVAGRPPSAGTAWRSIGRPRALGTVVLMWISVIAGLVCCIAPGIYLSVIFSLSIPVMLEEGRFGTAALRRSSALLRPATGDLLADPRIKSFVLSFVSWLFGYALTLLLQSPFLIAQQFFMFRELARGQQADPSQVAARMGWLQVPAAMLGTVGQVAAGLYYGCGVALLYFDLRRRKEGSDLEAAILSASGLPPDLVWPTRPDRPAGA